jgi:predicted RNA binding protein YcfA (HicA-like mRNA interferase family)
MPLSGKEMLKLFLKDGWIVLRKKGSHVQIQKIINNKIFHQTIPMHGELKKGLEKNLLKLLKLHKNLKTAKNGSK